MPWDEWRTKTNAKLDALGASSVAKIREQREAGSSVKVGDRIKLARGGDRWSSSAGKGPEGEGNVEGEEASSSASARSRVLAPGPPNRGGLSPPMRAGASSGTATRPPPPPGRKPSYTPSTGSGSSLDANASARARPGPPPPPPPRMANEAGTAFPPPPYGEAASSKPAPPPRRASSGLGVRDEEGQAQTQGHGQQGYPKFSEYGPSEKEALFGLLDEFFASRLNVSASPSSASQAAVGSAPVHVAEISTGPPKPSGPKPAATIQLVQATGKPSPTSSPPSSAPPRSSTRGTYPRLTASALSADEPCSALSAATFFCYPESYPEWQGAEPWFISPSPMPPPFRARNDLATSSRWAGLGTSRTFIGAALFADLSALWFKVEWDESAPAESASVECMYKEPPDAADEAVLAHAAESYGELIAGFAEQKLAEKRPVGDGECWTLASHAIEHAASANPNDPSWKPVSSVGRTHGHLIYAGRSGSTPEAQSGCWRGGDRFRERWGGVRRGDVLEWMSARCAEKNAPRGSFMKLGAPEHTAVIISDSPAPDRLSQLDADEDQPEMAPWELDQITTIEQSAGQVPTKRTYDLSTFTQGEIWIYRPISMQTYVGGPVVAEWPPALEGVERLA